MEQLEEALVDQLCGRYLRAKEGRHGILLLVHQKPRPRGWLRKKAAPLTFPKVVAHLRKMAGKISAAAVGGPQPEIASIDVSQFGKKAKVKAAGKRPGNAVKKTKETGAKTKKRGAAKAKTPIAKKKGSMRAKPVRKLQSGQRAALLERNGARH